MGRRAAAINLDAAYQSVRAVVRSMLVRRWGRIINVSSPSARMPLPGQAAYAASKAGLEGLTRALSRDLAAKGVLVNAVAPGLIETEMLEHMPAAARDDGAQGGGHRPARPAAGSRCAGRVSRVRRGVVHHRSGDRGGRWAALIRRSRATGAHGWYDEHIRYAERPTSNRPSSAACGCRSPPRKSATTRRSSARGWASIPSTCSNWCSNWSEASGS